MTKNPIHYGVPHDSWRPGQAEAVEQILRLPFTKPIIMDAPTGSGKTGIACAIGSAGVVTSLTKTKFLQDQYSAYGFAVLKGMSNYACALNPVFFADLCVHMDNMYECPVAGACSYLRDRGTAKLAMRRSLGYHYYFKAKWPREDEAVRYLVCDEAHDAPNIVMGNSTMRISPDMCKKYGLGSIPTKQMPSDTVYKGQILSWLVSVIPSLVLRREQAMAMAELSHKHAVTASRIGSFIDRIMSVSEGLRNMPDAYIVEMDVDSLMIIPMTARYDAQRLLSTTGQQVFMSATIGDPKVFAKSIGIDDYYYVEVKPNFSPSQMPVVVPLDAPVMSSKITESGINKQADVIAKIIRENDPEWPALVHFASVAATTDMAHRLSRRGLQDRVYVVSGEGTDGKILALEEKLKQRKNTVALTYSLHEGYDAPHFPINIIAKVPYATLDKFGIRVMKYDKNFYSWQAAVKVQQACGRNRRGDLERDYEKVGAPTKKVVAVVDNSVWRIKQYLSPYFADCLTVV